MNTKRQTAAAKAATNTNGSAQGAVDLEKIAQGKWARWRTTTRKGKRVLIDPAGHIYHGTAQEVRDAAMTPCRRDALARDITWARESADRLNFTPEEKREFVREKRREAIRTSCQFEELGEWSIHVPGDVYILLRAGARLVSDSFDEFLADLFRGDLEGLTDVAENVTGKREIPLTRYERAALERITRACAAL